MRVFWRLELSEQMLTRLSLCALCTINKAVLLTVLPNVVLSQPGFLTSYHNPPHLPRCMSPISMHHWAFLCVTQQRMLKQDEVMWSPSNTVVCTTSN